MPEHGNLEEIAAPFNYEHGLSETANPEDRFIVPKSRFDKLGKQGFSKNELHELVAPPRTLSRRKKTLSLEESDRVQRLERIVEHASRVFGSTEKAMTWLRQPCRAMDNIVPIEILVSETGAHRITMQLHAIDYGMYA